MNTRKINLESVGYDTALHSLLENMTERTRYQYLIIFHDLEKYLRSHAISFDEFMMDRETHITYLIGFLQHKAEKSSPYRLKVLWKCLHSMLHHIGDKNEYKGKAGCFYLYDADIRSAFDDLLRAREVSYEDMLDGFDLDAFVEQTRSLTKRIDTPHNRESIAAHLITWLYMIGYTYQEISDLHGDFNPFEGVTIEGMDVSFLEGMYRKFIWKHLHHHHFSRSVWQSNKSWKAPTTTMLSSMIKNLVGISPKYLPKMLYLA